MRTAWLLALTVLGCRASAVSPPPPANIAPATTPDAPATKTVPPAPWSFEYEGALVEHISADAEGVYVAMSALPGDVVRFHALDFAPTGHAVVGLWLSHRGELREAHVFDGELVSADGLHGSLLTLTSIASLEIAGANYTPPSREAVFGMPAVAIAVRLGETPEVVAMAPDVESAVAWPLAGGQVLLAAWLRDDTDETSTELQLFDREKRRWSASLPDTKVSAVLQTPRETWVALHDGPNRSRVRRLDLLSGRLSAPMIEVRALREASVDITAITGGPRAWGADGRLIAATSEGVEVLLDGTGHVAAVDGRDVLVDIYHLDPERKPPTVDETGIYLLREGKATRVDSSGSDATLTDTHIVVADDCRGAPCIRGIVR